MANAKDPDVDALRAEIQQLRADVAALGEHLRAGIKSKAGEALSRAEESGERLWQDAKKHVHDVAHEIEEKPVPAAITAFSLGVILGLIFSGRHR